MTQQEIMNYRADFPLLRESKVAYLDNAATSQRPDCVLDAQRKFYETHNANPLRGLYQLGMDATEDYAAARETVRRFLNAKSASEIIFTRNATESLNLVAYSYGLHRIGPEDEIVVSIAEHHSNMLPWRMVAGKPAPPCAIWNAGRTVACLWRSWKRRSQTKPPLWLWRRCPMCLAAPIQWTPSLIWPTSTAPW